MQRFTLVALPLAFALSLVMMGCVSLSSSSPTPPNSTTVVVPQSK
jgi:hypothetical protein